MSCRVVVVVLPHMNATSIAVTLQALEGANRIAERVLKRPRPFRIDVGSVEGNMISCGPGPFVLQTKRLSQLRPDLIIVPGTGAVTEVEVLALLENPTTSAVCRWLLRHAHRPIAASCTGVFVLAETGMLNGYSATTTWWLTNCFVSRFPEVRVNADAMVVEERGRFTAGAALAQLDLVLRLIAREAGPVLANLVARYLVVDERPSQARYIVPSHLNSTSPEVTAAERWIRRHLSRSFGLADVARGIGTSMRTLSRRIVAATGTAPLVFVRRIRIEVARHLLTTTKLSVEEIASRVGYQDPASLRRAFAKLGERPTDCRRNTRKRLADGRGVSRS
jgi:transcriptional regulator GlxA family with amidase domain